MNFNQHRQNTQQRFGEVILLLNHISSLEPIIPGEPTSIEVKILRGLSYVHLYGVFEKSINELVSSLIISINAFNVVHFHFVPTFNTIAAENYLRSFKDSSYKNFIPNASSLIEKLNCHDIPVLNETVFSGLLQNIWYNTILEIRTTFGLKELPLVPRLRATLDEVVDNRNAIAHGRLSPVVIGSTHKASIIRDKLAIVQGFNNDIIDEFEVYFINKRFIKRAVRNKY